MKIIVERKYRLGYYTIGVMTVEGKTFRCNTLEPTVRETLSSPSGVLPLYGEVLAQYGESPNWDVVATENPKMYRQFLERVKAIKAQHKKGETAIPVGTYTVKMHMSSNFKSYRPYLIAVPGFSGVMIHEGNTRKDTLGCILVGENTQKGMVLNSRANLKKLMEMIWEAETDHEPVEIVIK